MRGPCPSDSRTLRVDWFRRRRPLVRGQIKGPQGHAPKGASPPRRRTMLVAPSQRAASTIKASIRFVAILCKISWLPNLAPTFGLKRNPLGGEAGARRLRNDYAQRRTNSTYRLIT